MSKHMYEPLRPKDRIFLRVLIIARISTDHQDERSLDDQIAKVKEYLGQVYSSQIEFKIIKSRGSGEHLDRKELRDAEELIESGLFDLVISEDLARICRRKRAIDFCELCIDHNTRLIALNDNIDTAGDWEDSAFISTWHHERSNRDTSKRIKRSLRNRFTQGGVIQFMLYGYIKPVGAKTDTELQKDPSAEPIYNEWFQKLENGASYCEIADWLNAQSIQPGKYCRGTSWTGAMVGRVTHNPILKGIRVRNKKMAKRINKTGRHVSVNAPPEERLERNCPHLAFIDPERFDRVIAMLAERNACFKRKRTNGVDPRLNMPRKRTVWPGQHLRCGICNRIFYWYATGRNRLMKCSGNQNYKCWNGVEVNGTVAATKLTEAIFHEISNLPDFDDVFLQKARQQWQELHGNLTAKRCELERRHGEVTRKIANITDVIAGGQMRSLVEKLRDLEQESDSLTLELRQLASSLPPEQKLPSVDIIKAKAKEVFAKLGPDDPQVGRLLKALIPSLRVFPVRLCDGGRVELRAWVQLNLAALSDQPLGGNTTLAFGREIIVNLFDLPQRESFRLQVMNMLASELPHRKIATQLGVTLPVIHNAVCLQRRVDELGLTDPYVPVSETEMADSRFRRHLHPRYKFEPLDEDSMEV